jgi:hypothetical protein
MVRLIVSITLVLILAMGESPLAGGLSYADNQVFSHGYIDFDRAGPLVMPEYPCVSTGRKLVFETSYRSLYGLDELTDNCAGFAVHYREFILGAAFASFGKSDYFHQSGLAAVASYGYDRLRFGGAIIYHRISFNDKYDAVGRTTFNIGGTYRYDRILAYAVTRSINQPRYYENGRTAAPEAEFGVSYKSSEGLDSQVKTLFVRYQKPTAELAQSFRLADFASVNWALVLLPARFGAGINLSKGSFGFEYKISQHPVLGLTHTIGLSVFKQ